MHRRSYIPIMPIDKARINYLFESDPMRDSLLVVKATTSATHCVFTAVWHSSDTAGDRSTAFLEDVKLRQQTVFLFLSPLWSWFLISDQAAMIERILSYRCEQLDLNPSLESTTSKCREQMFKPGSHRLCSYSNLLLSNKGQMINVIQWLCCQS